MSVENTTKRDPFVHLAGVLGEGSTERYITGMEAEGQRQVVASQMLPTDGPWDELAALGFVPGDVDPKDDLFRAVTLPEGWRREASDHAMWSYIVDGRGIRQVEVFYKAAFYDRKAHFHLANPGYTLATDALYGDDPKPPLPAEWNVLNAAERGQFWRGVEEMVRNIAEYPDIYGKYQPKVDALLAHRG